MIRGAGRCRSALPLAVFAAALMAVAGCRSGTGAAAGPEPGSREASVAEGPSHAADATIEKAKTPEEKRALEKARDDVDAEMREKARALDAEIERLQRDNERLKK